MTFPADATWLPSEYQDDVIPPPRATPQDWVVTLSDGSHYLASGDPFVDDDEPGRSLKEGDVVPFDWTANSPTRHSWIDDKCIDDKWTPPLPALPVGSSDWMHMYVGDPILCGDDQNDLDDPPTNVTIYCWSDRSIPHTFTAGKFVLTGAPS